MIQITLVTVDVVFVETCVCVGGEGRWSFGSSQAEPLHEYVHRDVRREMWVRYFQQLHEVHPLKYAWCGM